VASCAGHRNGAQLIADNNVLCSDGPITNETELDPFWRLNSGGTFVVRSPGGNIVVAMLMAEILHEKHATVVVHDHCLSACANALFVASHETHVADGAIVAWHGGPRASCAEVSEILKQSADEAQKQWIAGSEQLCRNSDLIHGFYRKRGISDDFTRQPQTPYSRKMFQTMQRQEMFDKRRIFWTWHPQNFGSTFKSKIVFRSVPDSQEAIEARLRRLRFHARVVYDPPGEPPPIRPYCQNRRTATGEPCVELKN
jgi:hypothetical protein